MRKIFLKALLLCVLPLSAGPYLKMGTEPTVGLGARGSLSHHGLDISGDVEPKKTERHYKGKALYLFYPTPEATIRPYVGAGVSSRYTEQTVPYPTAWNRGKGELGSEAVIGYEFRSGGKTRLFTQLEVSNPERKDRSVGFSVGFGF